MSKDNITFSKSTLATCLKHHIQQRYFMFGNSLLRQEIGIPMGIDSAPVLQISFYTIIKTNTCLNLFQMIK